MRAYKSLSFASLTWSISDTPQLVCKHRRKHFPCDIMFVMTYWNWTPSLNYDKLYLNRCGQTTITERKQLRKKRKSSRLSTYSSTEESWITKRFSVMAFAETGTFNINDERNANKNYLLSSDSQSDGLCGERNRANQPWMKTSTCRTAHMWKNMIRGSWLDVSLFSHVGKAIRDIWLVYIDLRTKIYSAAFQCVNLSMYIINRSATIYLS